MKLDKEDREALLLVLARPAGIAFVIVWLALWAGIGVRVFLWSAGIAH